VRLALKFCWLLLFSVSLCTARANAQEASEPTDGTDSTEANSTEPAAAPTLPPKPWVAASEEKRLAAPDVYLLPDEYGKLRKVLGFRYEDFFEAWKRDEDLAVVAPPRYVLDAIEVSGAVQETHARLRVEFELTVQTDAWIDIALQLPNFIVQQLTIEGQAEGECLVFDPQRNGHVVWLAGKAGKKRKLVLEGLAKLKLSTGGDGVELYLPRATSAQFLLRVPGSKSRFESSLELDLATEVQEDGTTEVRLLGQANPLRLQWISEDETESNPSAVVEVVGQITVRVDRRRAYYDATLKINSFGSPLEQIRVRLPQGAKWDAGQSTGEYKIREVEAPHDSDLGQVLEIQTSKPLSKPWTVRLEAEQPLEADSGVAEYVVQGFEVLEAFRQSGTLTLEVDDQLQAYFDTFGDVDQVLLKESSTKPAGRSALARFAYARFPWRLAVFTSPRQRRVSVRPSYELTINSEDAQLEVEYKYQMTGAQIFSLHVNLHGWTLTDDPLESGGSVDYNRVVETREGHLVLPLVDPDVQEVRLHLTLRKNTELGDNTFQLPEPLGAFVVDGQLLVDSAEALRVTPKLDEITGLSVVSLNEGSPSVEPSSVRDPLAHSTAEDAEDQEQRIELHTFLPRPKFVAQVALRPRQVTVAAQTHVELDQQHIAVRQQLLYHAKYRPVSQLSLRVPEQLWANDSLSVTLDGQELPVGLGAYLEPDAFEDSFEEEALESGDTLRQLIVTLPRPMQHEIPLEVAYEVPAVEPGLEKLVPVVLPLMTPTDRFEGHKATIIASPPIVAIANPRSALGEWAKTTEDIAPGEELAALKLQTNGNLSFLSFHAKLDSVDKVQLATLERAWLQSWVSFNQRQERAVFRFRTPHPRVFVQLPVDLKNTHIEVLLDGEPVQHELLPNNRLAVKMPTERQRDSHAIELRYQQPTALPSWGTLHSELPQLECRQASAPIYWQLVMPRGWQVTASPKQLLADYWLGWKNYRWGRQPTLSQTDLERFTGVTSTVMPAPLSAEYVFRAFEIPAEIQVVVIRQIWVFLVGTLVAFGLGMLWLYTSLARSGIFWLCLSSMLLAGIFSYPEISLLAVQTLLLGGLLTLITFVLRPMFSEQAKVRFTGNGYQQGSSMEVTQSWQRQQHSQHSDITETTAALRTGEPLP